MNDKLRAAMGMPPVQRPPISDGRATKLRWAEANGYWWDPMIGLHRNPFPPFEPFPRTAKVQRRVEDLRSRLSDAVEVFRNGLPEGDDW